MGLIQRQAFKASLLRYVGVGVSAIATFLVYSNYKQEYGLYTFLFSAALILSPFISLGGGSLATKFHPNNQKDKESFRGLLSFLLIILSLGSIVFLILFFSFKSPIESLFIQENDDPLLKTYFLWVIPLVILVSLRMLLASYITNYGRIVVPELFGTFFTRLIIPFLVLAVGLKWITLDQYMLFILVTYAFSVVALFIYLLAFESSIFKIPYFIKEPKLFKPVLSFAAFAIFNSAASIIAVRVDTVMVGKMIDLTNAGAYTILLFLTNIILIPRNSIFQISGPIIARNIDTPNMGEVQRIYKSSSLVLLFAGLLISGLIILNIHDIIILLPKSEEFVGFFGVCVFLCLAYIFDMTTSINHHIIIYSKYYKVNLIMILIMAVANVLFNLSLIPIYGLVGAALSTFLSLLFYNLAKVTFIYRVYKIQPFSRNSLFILLSGVALYSLFFFIPSTGHAWLNILIRSTLFFGFYSGLVYYFRWTPQFNQLAQKLLMRFRP